MRTETLTRELYSYEELGEDAKETVRGNVNRHAWEDGYAVESMHMIFEGQLEAAGWRDCSGYQFGDLYSQGTKPAWSGIREGWEGPDERLYTLQVAASRYGALVEYVTDEETEEDAPNEVELAARDYVYDLSQTIFWAMREEDEWLGSEEYVAGHCEANGLEFTEEGELA